MMPEKRRHKRFMLDLMEVNGRLGLTDKVEIIDLSYGGVALRADRRLNIGKGYLLTLRDKGNSLVVKGVVVRCKLSGIAERHNRERALIYTAGMRFEEGSADKIADFIRNSHLVLLLEKRRHKRFLLDLIEISGRLGLTDKVEIIDISFGGVSLKADRRLNIGKEYLFTLGDKGNSLVVRGVVVRCKLSGIEERYNGERALIYTAGMRFDEGSANKIADFIRNSILA
ncbi:MAG TPA: PilZ domain-containing protein [Nitrospirota bacterium]|nr:PilZ domain-containing protein [Nitrospirota bacterium]